MNSASSPRGVPGKSPHATGKWHVSHHKRKGPCAQAPAACLRTSLRPQETPECVGVGKEATPRTQAAAPGAVLRETRGSRQTHSSRAAHWGGGVSHRHPWGPTPTREHPAATKLCGDPLSVRTLRAHSGQRDSRQSCQGKKDPALYRLLGDVRVPSPARGKLRGWLWSSCTRARTRSPHTRPHTRPHTCPGLLIRLQTRPSRSPGLRLSPRADQRTGVQRC